MERGKELPLSVYCVPGAAMSAWQSGISLNLHIPDELGITNPITEKETEP